MDVGKKIYERRKELGLTLEEVGNLVGVSKSTVRKWETGYIENMKRDKIEKLSNALNIGIDILMGWEDKTKDNELISDTVHPYKPAYRIPILGRISAGLPLYADEQIIDYTYTELNGGAEYFGLLVSGDSMNATTIVDGSVIIVRKQDNVDNGQVAVVLVDGEDATVKRFYRERYTITLMPQSNNPIHKPQMYDLREVDIQIIGKVMEVKNTIQ